MAQWVNNIKDIKAGRIFYRVQLQYKNGLISATIHPIMVKGKKYIFNAIIVDDEKYVFPYPNFDCYFKTNNDRNNTRIVCVNYIIDMTSKGVHRSFRKEKHAKLFAQACVQKNYSLPGVKEAVQYTINTSQFSFVFQPVRNYNETIEKPILNNLPNKEVVDYANTTLPTIDIDFFKNAGFY